MTGTATHAVLIAGHAVATPFRSRLEVSGADRTTFLHNFCTADIKKLAVGECCEAFFTNGKGHVLAHTLVFATEAKLIAYSLADDLATLVPHLDRYIIREDVTLRDATGEPGPWLASTDFALPAGLATNVNSFVSELQLLDGKDATARASLAEQLGETPLASEAACDTLRVASRWPLHGVDFDDRALPQELSREAAISFHKGCYLGQETVARLDALGHVNKRIVQLKLTADDVPAALPTDWMIVDKKAGVLTSVAESPDGDGLVGLAMLRSEFS